MAKKIYIASAAHGVPGTMVEYTQLKLERDIKAARKRWSKEDAKRMHSILAKSLTEMLPSIIQNGYAVDAWGERYSKETFDTDLVAVAVYDHIGNGRPIVRQVGNLTDLH